jgi:hypothetical protein
VITASESSWDSLLHRLSLRQFGKLVTVLRRAGADAVRKGRPWSLPLEDRALLMAASWRTNLTMRQLVPLFGISKSAADRIIDHLGPMLALQPSKRFAKDTVLIVDGTLVPTRDHIIAERSKNYRYSGGIYGSPRVHAVLKREGVLVGRKRVERLMREAGLAGISPRRTGKGFTRRDRDAELAPDLVRRDFTADGLNRLWVTDLTMIPTGEGPLWLSAIRDAFSRRVVAWETAARADADLVLTTLEYALASREVEPRAVDPSCGPRLPVHVCEADNTLDESRN